MAQASTGFGQAGGYTGNDINYIISELDRGASAPLLKAQTGLANAQAKSVKADTKRQMRILDLLLGNDETPGLISDLTGSLNQPGSPDSGGGSLQQPGFPDNGGVDESLIDRIRSSGDSLRSDINENFDAASGSALANLQIRGFAGSNALPAEFGSIERGRASALGAVESGLLGTEIGVRESAAGRQLERDLVTKELRGRQQSSLMNLLAQLLG